MFHVGLNPDGGLPGKRVPSYNAIAALSAFPTCPHSHSLFICTLPDHVVVCNEKKEYNSFGSIHLFP